MLIISITTFVLLVMYNFSVWKLIRKFHGLAKKLYEEKEHLCSVVKDLCTTMTSFTEIQSGILEIAKNSEIRSLLIARCSQTSLIVLRANAVSMLNMAIKYEKYEDAEDCKRLIKFIDELIAQEIS